MPEGEWEVDGRTVPRPSSIVRVDYESKHVQAPVLVFGADAGPCLRLVFEKTGGGTPPPLTSDPSFTYVPLSLPEIRGFRTTFHVYALDAQPRSLAMLMETIAHADGLIVAHTADDASPLVSLAASQLAEVNRAVPTAVLGPSELAAQWSRLSGTAPIYAAQYDDANVVAALKEVTKAILGALRSRPSA